MISALASLDVLVVDGQSTGASPAHGHLLELGWARTRAAQADEALVVEARLLALPEGATIPRPVARLTGIGPADLAHAHAPARVWAALREAAAPLAPGGAPLPGWARGRAQRQGAFDVASFDRLRVLTTELRRVVAEGRGAELRLGPREALGGERLRRALAWV